MVKRPFRRRSRPRRFLDLALAAAILAMLALVVARGPYLSGPAETLSGSARATDGDSLSLAGARIRLEGIDAPELGQTCMRDGAIYACGRDARSELARLAEGAEVTCESRRRDRYDRLLARCVARGVDLNRAMVEVGWAVSYGGYAEAEREARRQRRGLWAGDFDIPQDWRRVHGGLAESPHGWIAGLVGWLRSAASGIIGDDDIVGEDLR